MNQELEPVVVYGAGGHAKSVIGVLRDTRRHVLVGVVDDDPSRAGAMILGCRVVGGSERLAAVVPPGGGIHVAIGDNASREAVVRHLRGLGHRLVTLVHPAAFVMAQATLGEGIFVHHGAVIGCDATLGTGTIVSAQAIVGHDCRLGHFDHLTPGVRFAGGVTLGNRVLIGMNAVVLPGIRIGDDVTIAAGSVVTRDVPDGVVAAGMPARIVRPAATEPPATPRSVP